MTDQSEYCTIAKASAILNVSDRYISILVSAGRIQSYGQGRLMRVSVSSLHIFKEANPDGIGCQPRGYIYVIYWHGYYKIGQAANPERRIKGITHLHPNKPELIHIIPTDSMDRLEQHLHKWFSDKRVSGEWFDLNDEDIQRVKAVRSHLMDYKTRNFPDLPE